MCCSDVERSIINTGNWVKVQLQDINNVRSAEFRKILYYSLIDSFVQSHNKYPKHGEKKAFSEFLLTFSTKFNLILEKTCPVTLFYCHKDEFHFDRLDLPDGYLLCADDERLHKESDRLLLQISNPTRRLEVRKKHQYSQLMYAERNKLVHELSPVGMPMDLNEAIPHMAQGQSMEKGLSYDAPWHLVIPESFVKLVLEDSISGYLQYCQKETIIPFSNNDDTRRCRMAWYD